MRARTFPFWVAGSVLVWAACSSDRILSTSPGMESDPVALAASAGGIAPPASKPHGRSYSEWAAEWWKWAVGTPVSTNPVLDPTGENCAIGQSDHVWFLAGSFGSDPVVRECTIPTGDAVLVPLINFVYFGFLSDPPEQRTEEFIRSQVTCIEDAEFALVEVDGVPVQDPGRYLERSTVFDILLPEDNILGATEDDIPELTLSPSVDAGFYLLFTPRTPGEHTIHWQASSEACGFGQDITYHLTVRPGRG
jgi:hypothetical protein